MEQHGLVKGGVKATALSKMDKHNKQAVWALMPKMHVWVVMEKVSPHKAAKLVAAQRGIPGASFDAVVTDLRKTYPKWLELIKQDPEVGKTL
jgi:leucyl aminopeptidase (aminopeptidase T)